MIKYNILALTKNLLSSKIHTKSGALQQEHDALFKALRAEQQLYSSLVRTVKEQDRYCNDKCSQKHF